jgi:toxin ParE1/3/4
VRYEALLAQAAVDLAQDPRRPGARVVGSVLVYHLVHSRDRVPDPPGRVRRPRHLLVARPGTDGVLDVLGIVHERMLLGRALRGILRDVGGEEP